MLFYAPSCGSTQDLVPLCARQAGGKHPIALLTFHQTSGRGQLSRTWEAEPGQNLAMSVWLPLKKPRLETCPLLNMALTVACINAFRQHEIAAEIKWPNDLRYKGAKLAGLLMEIQGDSGSGKALCLGIGINVNQTDFDSLPQPATSLKNITGKEHNLMDLASSLLKRMQTAFSDWKKQPDNVIFLQNYNDEIEGRNSFWEAENTAGKILKGFLNGVDAQGRLLFETGGEITAYHHGVIRLKRPI
ncbi:MAG: biotin--[acetyl-CoA-carboxylase] ligase [Bacteroidetes bacterium]|nr:biotin--[acetyl-CoA-carboxylase] ligase [Bacteroidota bacterium]